MPRKPKGGGITLLPSDPQWYRDAVIYEVHVRAFHDGDGDGIGDFKGLTEKLDYLSDLGVTALWLLPFYPSPVKDGGYDISDYLNIHPQYGTLEDFRRFLDEAHKHGIRVITELVINHTSDQHPWFQRARSGRKGSRHRDFYVWSDTPDHYREARIIFKDFENSNWAWDAKAKAYYWHRFYSHQPDLNYDSPDVRRAIFRVIDFWFGMGVDGMRLDAVPYLYEREGTNCENLPETHELLKELRRHVDERFSDKMLIGEANQWPEDAADYFGAGDECHMNFHFPIMPRLFMSLSLEDRFPLVEILEQTPPVPEGCQWAIFIRNHDELTLEMVTDEERDFMYRVYASDPQARLNLGIRRRLAPLMNNDRRRIELLSALLFSLPGTPVIYYGDEIGMGDNIYLGDRDGVRTPMQWSPDRNAGFSFANPQQLYLPVIIDPQYNFAAVNVEIQRENPTSLWWWTKRMIGLRNRCRAFGRGSFELVHPSNPKILAFLRRWEDEIILVVANLSRHPQQAELDLSEFEGRTPVELSGNTAFESVRDMPYCASLNPYGFFWFALQPKAPRGTTPFTITRSQLPVLTLPRDGWEGALRGRNLSRLQGILPGFLKGCRWFASKSRTIDDVAIRDIFWIKGKVKADRVAVLLLRVDYLEAESELYVLPIACASGEEQSSILDKHPQAAVALIESPDSGRSGLLYDAAFSPAFPPLLLRMFRGRRAVGGRHGHLTSYRVSGAASTLRGPMEDMQPKLLEAEQSNTSILYGDRFILKLYRKLENGENPELEISRYLTHNAPDVSTPHLIGHLSYEVRTRPSVTVGVLQEFVPNHGDAWIYTLHVLDRFFERILANPDFLGGPPASYLDRRRLLDRALNEPKKAVLDMIGAYVESAHLLGRRTAELHKALARAESDPAFEPEPFTRLYQRSLFQSMSNLARSNFQLLQSHLKSLGVQTSSLAERVLAHRAEVFERFQRLRSGKMEAWRIRCHGDYHLGQVLNTGKDFVVIDFEGEPARSLGERQLKRSPFRDTAGMLRSFHYAAYQALKKQRELGLIQTDRESAAIAWADLWTKSVGAEFMRSYMECVAEEPLLAVSLETANLLLEAYLLDKAVYEVGYELNNRPEWVDIPLAGILWLVEGDS